MRSSSALAGVVAQRIDRGADVEHQPGFAIEIDALGEVTGDARRDNVANRRQELAGPCDVGFALGIRLPVLLGLMLGFAPRLVGKHLLDPVDRPCRRADLVPALDAGDLDLLALRKPLQQTNQDRKRLGNAAPNEEGENRHTEQKHEGRDLNSRAVFSRAVTAAASASD